MSTVIADPTTLRTGARVPSADPWGHVPNNLASASVPEPERALEVKLLWGATCLETLSVTRQPTVTIGDERRTRGFGPFAHFAGCDLVFPSRALPGASHVLASRTSATGCTYTIEVPPKFGARLERARGGVEAVAGGHVLGAEETLYLAEDELVLQLRYVRRTKLIPPELWRRLDYAWVNVFILVLFFHVLMVAGFLATPLQAGTAEELLFRNPVRFVSARLGPAHEPVRSDVLTKLKGGARREGSDAPARTRPITRPTGGARSADTAEKALSALFGDRRGRGVFEATGHGVELSEALERVARAEVGDASGVAGTRGGGPGDSGPGRTVGISELGRPRGADFGTDVGRLEKAEERDIDGFRFGTPEIRGALDKEVIRTVIKEHLAQVRYCYERELVRTPGLAGKISTELTIGRDGRVTRAEVRRGDSTLDDTRVEDCIVERIRSWVFPKPKGGGVVVVRYPFVFRTSG